MYIATRHILIPAVLAALLLPATETGAFLDERFFEEIEQSVKASLENARSVSETGEENTNSASVINETRAEASSSNGKSEARVQSKTIINGEVVEDVDETVENGAASHETNIETGGVEVHSRTEATAQSSENQNAAGNDGADGADGTVVEDIGETFGHEAASSTDGMSVEEGEDRVEHALRIGERVQALTERLFSLIDTYVFSIFGN